MTPGIAEHDSRAADLRRREFITDAIRMRTLPANCRTDGRPPSPVISRSGARMVGKLSMRFRLSRLPKVGARATSSAG
jgi:hypothetical protein